MQIEGPPLEALTRRLAETPEDFLAPPGSGAPGQVHVAAVAADLLEKLGSPATVEELTPLGEGQSKAATNRQAITLLLCWLLADEWTAPAKLAKAGLLELLGPVAEDLAGQAPAAKYLQDPDRREELTRLALGCLGRRPAGETPEQAQDRLTSISSAERARVVRASRAAEERARQVREALARQAAEESADKWTRE